MKRIKTYKLFESTETNIREDIKDIFLELKDEGFEVYVDALNHLDPKEVTIKKGSTFNGRHVNVNTFLLEDVYEYILTCKSYLKEVGFIIDEIKGWAKVTKDDATILTGPETNFILDDNIHLYESDPEENKLFDKPLMSLTLKIRKS
jgi:hypothetical protein